MRCGGAADEAGFKCVPRRDGATRRPWSQEEDRTILDYVGRLGVRWRQIAAQLPGRSDDAVRNRFNRLQETIRDNPGALELSVESRPKAGYRCSRCGLLKRNHVCLKERPGLHAVPAAEATPRPYQSTSGHKAGTARVDGEKLRTGWTRHEDETIRLCVHRVGPRWSLIAAELPGRTEHAVRNRWHRLQCQDEHSALMERERDAQEVDHLRSAVRGRAGALGALCEA